MAMMMLRSLPCLCVERGLCLLVVLVTCFAVTTARADYRTTMTELRIGIIRSHPAVADPIRQETVRQAYAKAIGLPVEIVTFASFGALIDAHASGRVHYAFHSAKSFAATEAVCGCVRALRRPVAADGATGFRSVLAVREAAAATRLADLDIGYSDETSASGWEIPRRAIKTGSLEAPTMVRGGSVAGVLDAYEMHSIDGFFGWVPDYADSRPSDASRMFGGSFGERLEEAGPMRIIWLSEPVLNGPHALHQSVPEDLAASLGTFLDTLPERAPGLLDLVEPVLAGGFVAAGPTDYSNLAGLVTGLAEALPDGTGQRSGADLR